MQAPPFPQLPGLCRLELMVVLRELPLLLPLAVGCTTPNTPPAARLEAPSWFANPRRSINFLALGLCTPSCTVSVSLSSISNFDCSRLVGHL